MRRLVQEGYLGTPLHVQVQIRSGGRLDVRRPFDWWSEARRGGGALGALGSHAVDWLRWMFGEVDSACGTLHTFVDARTAAGELRSRRVDADDYAAFWLRFPGPRPVHAAVVLSAVAHRGGGLRFEVFGTEGSLVHDDEGRLWGSRRELVARSEHEQPPLEELGEAEGLPASDLKQLPDSPWARAFAHLARALVVAVRDGHRELPGAAHFADGLAVQRVLDTLRGSARAGAWVDLRAPV